MTPCSNDHVTAPRRDWLPHALQIVLLLACGLVLSRNHADPDFWGHVQYGRDALRDGLPSTATYTYTGLGYRWINHENLSELAFAWGVDQVGPWFLLWCKTLAGMALCASLLVLARRYQVRAMVVVALLLLTSLNLMFFWSLRPQLFSYIYFAMLVLLLDRAFRHWSEAAPQDRRFDHRPLLWGAPFVMGLWANTHGGFVLGLGFFTAYLGLRSLEAVIRDPRRGWRDALILGTLLAVSIAATGINPYGWSLHRWLSYSLGSPRPEIVEWRPPELLSILWWQWWLLAAVSVAAFACTRRRRDPVQSLLLAVVLWQSLAHQRHIPFFAILFAVWGLPHLDSAWRRWASASDETPATGWAGWPRWGAAVMLALAAVAIVWQIGLQNREIPVARNGYPVSAFQFMADRQLHGRLVSRFKWAQYALATFGPMVGPHHMQLAFDGRFRTCYPQRVVDMYFDFAIGDSEPRMRHRGTDSPPPDPARILHYGRPDLVLIDRSQTLPIRVMREHQDTWVLLYQDGIAQLWGRRSKYDDPQSPDFLPLAARRVDDARQEGHVAWPALPAFPGQPLKPDLLSTAGTP